jgi:hypothetical protein
MKDAARSPEPADVAPEVTDEFIAEVADAAAADTRTVLRRVAGLPVRGRRGSIIDRELAARGFSARGR